MNKILRKIEIVVYIVALAALFFMDKGNIIFLIPFCLLAAVMGIVNYVMTSKADKNKSCNKYHIQQNVFLIILFIIFICAGIDERLLWLDVGIMFIGMGVVYICTEKRLFDVIIILIGAVVASFGIMFYISNNWLLMIPMFFVLSFVCFLYPIHILARITVLGYEAVSAKCVKVDAHRSIAPLKYGFLEGETIKRPTFCYDYKGERFTSCNELYSWLGVPDKDEWVTLYVNPLKPEKYMRVSKQNIIIFIVVGGVFLLTGIFMFLAYRYF